MALARFGKEAAYPNAPVGSVRMRLPLGRLRLLSLEVLEYLVKAYALQWRCDMELNELVFGFKSEDGRAFQINLTKDLSSNPEFHLSRS